MDVVDGLREEMRHRKLDNLRVVRAFRAEWDRVKHHHLQGKRITTWVTRRDGCQGIRDEKQDATYSYIFFSALLKTHLKLELYLPLTKIYSLPVKQ